MEITTMDARVARKKSGPKAEKSESKRYGTLIRVSDEFADALRKASALADISHSDFADAHLLALVQKIYRDTLAKESRRMGGGGSGAAE